ncbi:DivIVA-like cell division protein Wag31 [Actinomycetospora sp. CA-101289]|uniref:DivIVA-like cell division protein Wag31 n=1 Tax=Actinomycetospora sp. CA-101289 TaxID=3239893 RepID=UPI003D95F882
MPLTPADVHNVAFSKPPIGKRGYNEDEVDAFLDLVEAELGRLLEENNDLREQVEQLEQQLSTAHADLDDARSKAAAQSQGSGPATQVSAPPPSRPVEDAPRTVQQPMPPQQPQPQMTQTQQAVVPPPFGVSEQGQGGGANGGDHHVQAAKVLGLAQEMADRLTAEAKSEADGMLTDARTKSEQLLSEARTKSDSMVNEARTRAETMLNDARTRAETLERQARDKASTLERDAQRKHNETISLIEQQKGGLEKKIDELRTFEREYRTRLKTYLESQLRDLEGRGSAAPSDNGRNGSGGGYATSGYGSRAEAGS